MNALLSLLLSDGLRPRQHTRSQQIEVGASVRETLHQFKAVHLCCRERTWIARRQPNWFELDSRVGRKQIIL